MIVCGSSVAFLLGTVTTWRTLALTGNLQSYRICHSFEIPNLLKVSIIYRTDWWVLFEGLVPCLVLLIGLFFVPESPRWLVSIYIQLRLEKIDEKIETKAVLFQAKVGREKEFEVALRRLRGKDADVSKEAAEIQVLPFINHE